MSSDIVRAHLRNGEWDLARIGAEQALASAPEVEHGVLYALLARSLYRLGKPRAAMRAAEEGAQRSEHWEVSLALGEALTAMGQPLAAKALLTEALRVAREEGGLSEAANAMHSTADAEAPWSAAEVDLGTALAEACRAAGDADTGLNVARRAVALAERYFGPGSLHAAEASHALGVCLHGAAQDDEAKEVLEHALAIRRADNPEHTDVAATLDSLGTVARARKRPFDAVKLHREAMELWTRRLGKDAGPLGACHHGLAQALHRTGDFLAAREEMRHAYLISGRTLGEDHVDTWITAFELARMDMDCGNVMEGMAKMETARAVVKERLGAEHPVVLAMNSFL